MLYNLEDVIVRLKLLTGMPSYQKDVGWDIPAFKYLLAGQILCCATNPTISSIDCFSKGLSLPTNHATPHGADSWLYVPIFTTPAIPTKTRLRSLCPTYSVGTAHRCNLNGLSSGTAILIAGGDAKRGYLSGILACAAAVRGSHFAATWGGRDGSGVGRPREALRMGECEKMVASGLYPVHSINASLGRVDGIELEEGVAMSVTELDETESMIARCTVTLSPL